MAKYSKECCPRILKEEHFTTLKRNVDRVVVKQGLTWDIMEQFPDGHFTRFVLLDHMDWLTNEQIQDEWHVITNKAAPDARVLWRSFRRHIDARYPFFVSLRPYIDDVSDDVYSSDRVKSYLGTYVAKLPADLSVPRLNLGLSNDVSTVSKLACVANMLVHPLITAALAPADHRSRMDAFYEGQARAYDAVRESMLSGRKALISLMGPFDGKKSVWLDIGGGTGRNIRYLKQHLDLFDAIVIVDICAPLLDEGERVAQATLEKRDFKKISWVCVDCTSENFVETVYRETGLKTFDRVTFSYSLTMIPDWRGAIRQATKMCKGGKLMVADFDTYSEKGDSWKDTVMAKWFAQDSVVINPERRQFLKSELGPLYEKRWTEDGLVPGLGLPHYILSANVHDDLGMTNKE